MKAKIDKVSGIKHIYIWDMWITSEIISLLYVHFVSVPSKISLNVNSHEKLVLTSQNINDEYKPLYS